MKGIRVAVLIASHNRRDKTLACLRALFHQTFIDTLFADIDVKIFLLDDCSTDGTAEAIQVEYPSVILVRGNGYLFWNKGMHRIWEQTLESDYDYYLWLNDDTLLIPEALSCLLTTHQQLIASGYTDSIIVGSTQDAKTKAMTYGGIIRSYPWHPLKFSPVPPGDAPTECETMNGNCVLIPQSVALKVGNLDPQFSHSLGDFDYGLRARQSGCSVWIAPGYLGTCSLNSTQGTWRDADVPLNERFQKAEEPKGLPTREWFVFARRHAGPFWYVYWISPYIRLFLTSLIARFTTTPKVNLE